MKLVSVIGVGLLVAGCATTEQLEQANARADALEQRLARIENDLYRVEVKRAPALAPKPLPALAPVKPLEPTVQEMKIKAFLKEYVGVEFGDTESKYKRHDVSTATSLTNFPKDPLTFSFQKPFGCFNKVFARFEGDQLYEVAICMEINGACAYDFALAQANQTIVDLSFALGIPADILHGGREYTSGDIDLSSKELDRNLADKWQMDITFSCYKISKIAESRHLIANVDRAVCTYNMKYGKYPSSLDLLMVSDQGDLPLLQTGVVDSWGNQIVYRKTGPKRKPLIYSFGPDGKDDDGNEASDDITNRKPKK